MVVFVVLLGVEIFVKSTAPSSSVGDRIITYVAAFAMFYAGVTALYEVHFRSMLRYVVGIEVFFGVGSRAHAGERGFRGRGLAHDPADACRDRAVAGGAGGVCARLLARRLVA